MTAELTLGALPAPGPRPGSAGRVATRRHFLMCRPTHFDVTYAINPWMDPAQPVDRDLALAQWETLRRTYLDLGHVVDVVEGRPGLPDMVFAANGALVVGGRALGVRFRNAERAPEAAAYLEWLQAHGFPEARLPEHVNEGEGDYLVVGPRILAGFGFRTDARSHAEVAAFADRPVVPLELVDARYYHLDTALAVLDDATVAYLPEAFSPAARAVLEALYPDAVLAVAEDAALLGLNAVSDGRHVVLPAGADRLAAGLAARGFDPVPVDLSELRKAGGAAKCCTLELRD